MAPVKLFKFLFVLALVEVFRVAFYYVAHITVVQSMTKRPMITRLVSDVKIHETSAISKEPNIYNSSSTKKTNTYHSSLTKVPDRSSTKEMNVNQSLNTHTNRSSTMKELNVNHSLDTYTNRSSTKKKLNANHSLEDDPRCRTLVKEKDGRNKSKTSSKAATAKDAKRFKFIHETKLPHGKGPVVNSIPCEVTWRHDLAHKLPCKGQNPRVLAVVISAPGHQALRDRIRKSWASPALYPRSGLKAVFAIGAVHNSSLRAALDAESRQYNDIIQNNFLDSYGNLTYKTISWLDWVVRNCPETPFVAKVDDDVVVNPLNLRSFLQLPDISSKDQTPSSTGAIFGDVLYKGIAHRTGRWALQKEDYPESKLPTFALGPAYILTRKACKRLWEDLPHVPFVWLEDVFLTGLVAHYAGVPCVKVPIFQRSYAFSFYKGSSVFMKEGRRSDKDKAFAFIASLTKPKS
ncbi:beta-1,3-galactosyltransferase 2-like [Penaeus indicus]|uniref:beta-1,3-galactosyltransferase 2-like n=1 Tax=Penaeus indicus TaxID=29960 RepID=UPI00300DB2DC